MPASFAAAVLATGLLLQGGPPTVQLDQGSLFHDVEILAADDMEGRLAGSEGGRKARAYILRRFQEAGVAPIGGTFERSFTFTDARTGARTGTNIIGTIKGTRQPGRYIVLTAHYDHVGVRNGRVYNGADDNASGVAALLAAAAHFSRHPPEHSLLIAALDAEEAGLEGAKALLRDPPIPLQAMALNVNMDMVGRDAGNRLFAVGTRHYPFLRPLLEKAAQPPVRLLFGHDGGDGLDDWTADSDHHPFHEAGIPFVYFGVEDTEHQHRPTDDAATIGREFLTGAAATVVAAVRALDAHLDQVAGRGPRR